MTNHAGHELAHRQAVLLGQGAQRICRLGRKAELHLDGPALGFGDRHSAHPAMVEPAARRAERAAEVVLARRGLAGGLRVTDPVPERELGLIGRFLALPAARLAAAGLTTIRTISAVPCHETSLSTVGTHRKGQSTRSAQQASDASPKGESK